MTEWITSICEAQLEQQHELFILTSILGRSFHFPQHASHTSVKVHVGKNLISVLTECSSVVSRRQRVGQERHGRLSPAATTHGDQIHPQALRTRTYMYYLCDSTSLHSRIQACIFARYSTTIFEDVTWFLVPPGIPKLHVLSFNFGTTVVSNFPNQLAQVTRCSVLLVCLV